jgi:ABC-type multidrug transport system fused ATPase/permease subunit
MRYKNSFDVKNYKLLYKYIDENQRSKLKKLLILMVIGSFTEAFSIGALLPFLAVLNSPNEIYKYIDEYEVIKIMPINDGNDLIFITVILFILLTAINGILKIIILRYSTKVSFEIGRKISKDVYSKTIYQEYKKQINTNSSEIIDAITNKTNGLIYNTIIPILNLINATVILIMLIILLMSVEPLITSLIFATIGIIYIIIAKKVKMKLQECGEIIIKESNNKIKNLQEGLSSIRDLIMGGSQEIYIKNYEKIDLRLRKSQADSLFISQSPRIIIEAIGVIIISIIAYIIINQSENKDYIIGILGTIGLGVQRMLPALQNIYSSWASIYGSEKSMVEILKIVELENEIKKRDQINKLGTLGELKTLELKNVYYKYEKINILNDVNLKINKGDCIGIVGKTGSGKSTFIDLAMGLINPTEGLITINNITIGNNHLEEWRRKIAHVPQHIYLIDATIKENIAFGSQIDAIDMEQIKRVSDIAQISEEIEQLSDKYETIVGERGVKLSGGQIQRLGIARALYTNKEILILDEATSALDHTTESRVMESIFNSRKEITMLIIAHRISTLNKCNKIIKIENGKLTRIIL